MSSIEEALNFVESLVHAKTGEHLNDLQRIMLRECWQSTKKTYDHIATKYDYSANYIKQGVGPKLWKLLSQVMEEKVTKNNFHAVLERHISRHNLSRNKAFLAIDKPGNITASQHKYNCHVIPASSNCTNLSKLELPIDNVPLNSPFYIERTPYESRCYQEIMYPGAFIRIKGPRQMGKSSLMHRIINCTNQHQYQAVLINLQQAESDILQNLDQFLRWFCANLARQLKLDANLDRYWDEVLGAKMSCTYYLQEYIFEQIDTPIVIALEEVNEIIEYPQTAPEFLTLLRFWHEKTKTELTWQKLRTIMVHSTEIYIPLDINQSPLNVGMSIELEPFNRQQIEDLVLRHGINLNTQEIARLMDLVDGYPYLIRQALYHLASQNITLEELIITAPTDTGIYRDHLHRHLRNLEFNSELTDIFKTVLQANKLIKIEQIAGFKLHSMGLVKLDGNQVKISCNLYQKYFYDRLLVN